MKKRVYQDLVKILKLIVILLFVLILILGIIRKVLQKQLDDVSPKIPCEQELLEKADVFYVIPKFDNKNISENQEWCENILSLNKSLALHGVYHTYNEFSEDRDIFYLQEGIQEFEDCFNKSPKSFKPPQIKLSKNNKKLIKQEMELDYYFNQIFHKVYHCNDSGKFSNKFIDIF